VTATKENVNVFNRDVEENQGYRYTTNTQFSSVVSNRRLTKVTLDNIPLYVKTIVDIGCGDGTYTAELAHSRNDLTFSGTDPAVKAIEIALRNYPAIDFFTSNILLPESFANRHYDMAIIRGVLHHLSDQQKALDNTLILADNVLIIEPNGNNPVLKYIEKHSRYHVEHEEQSFSTKQLVKWCEQAGYKVQSIQYVGFVPFFFPTLASRIIYFFQPILERVPLLRCYFSAQIVIVCNTEIHGKSER
jgi:SAM-dependent methyltransferase